MEDVRQLEQRMNTIAMARDRFGDGRQADDLEAQRQTLEDKCRALLQQATDGELIALEHRWAWFFVIRSGRCG